MSENSQGHTDILSSWTAFQHFQLVIGAFPASKEIENEDDDENDWRGSYSQEFRSLPTAKASLAA